MVKVKEDPVGADAGEGKIASSAKSLASSLRLGAEGSHHVAMNGQSLSLAEFFSTRQTRPHFYSLSFLYLWVWAAAWAGAAIPS